MVGRLHRPDLVTVFAECLAGVCTHSWIHKNGLAIIVQDERSHVVVVVLLGVIATFGGEEETVVRVLPVPAYSHLKIRQIGV